MNRIRKIIVTGFGTGYLPIAPGTWGSAAVCTVFLVAAYASGGSDICVNAVMALVALGASAVCVVLGRFAEGAFGGKDPSRCTIDEYAGQALTFLLLPVGSSSLEWLAVAAAAFLAFRLFDIVKPPPARRMEKLPLGWGILLDDIIAGIYANVACQLVLRLCFPLASARG